MRRDKTDEYERRLDTGEAKARLPYYDTIERLIRERDAALAVAEKANARWIEMAKVAGEAYRKGVEDAERAYKTKGADNMEWDYFSCASAAILALLEQTDEANAMRKK